MIGSVPKYSKAFWIPVVFCWITDVTAIRPESISPRPLPTKVPTVLTHELTVFVTVLNHVEIAFPVLVRILPDVDVVVPEVLDELEVVVVLVVDVPDVVDDVVEFPVVAVVVPVVVQLVAVLVVGVVTIFFNCCPKPVQKDDIHPESERPESSGRMIFISGRFDRLATISSIWR